MKKTIFFLLLGVSPLFMYCQKQNTNYISLVYAYEYTERPTPVIVFYIDSFVVNDADFVGRCFRITPAEFEQVESIVKSNSSYVILDSNAVRYYDFNIVNKKGAIIYGTVNLRKSKEVFSKILAQLTGAKDFREILKAFEYLYTQLKPIGEH